MAGAALGTLISRAFEFAVICGYFLLRDRKLRFRVRDLLLPCGDLLPEYLRISLPVLVSDTLLGLGNSMTMGGGRSYRPDLYVGQHHYQRHPADYHRIHSGVGAGGGHHYRKHPGAW